MPDTIEDRGIVIVMRRRARDEKVQPYRTRRDGPALHQLRGRVAGWVRGQLDQLGAAVPAMPVEDRAADTWEPLVTVADAAGGHWPAMARAAILGLVADDQEPTTVSLRVRLLIDCRTAFGDAEGLPTATLLDRLKGDDEAPWASLGGNGLNPRSLGIMLREFGVTSANRRWPAVCITCRNPLSYDDGTHTHPTCDTATTERTDMTNDELNALIPGRTTAPQQLTQLPLVLTVEEAAERLGVGRTIMYALVSSGAVESVRIGRLRRVPTDALVTFLDSLRATHRAQGGAA